MRCWNRSQRAGLHLAARTGGEVMSQRTCVMCGAELPQRKMIRWSGSPGGAPSSPYHEAAMSSPRHEAAMTAWLAHGRAVGQAWSVGLLRRAGLPAPADDPAGRAARSLKARPAT
jgi:hypothetical protein